MRSGVKKEFEPIGGTMMKKFPYWFWLVELFYIYKHDSSQFMQSWTWNKLNLKWYFSAVAFLLILILMPVLALVVKQVALEERRRGPQTYDSYSQRGMDYLDGLGYTSLEESLQGVPYEQLYGDKPREVDQSRDRNGYK